MTSITHICGLGNPGSEHAKQRHNIGFMFLDYLAQKYRASAVHQKKNCLLHSIDFHEKPLELIAPQGYMNLSGEVLMKYLNFKKIAISQCLVLYDDVDLPFGTLRLREKGSAGTHNGLRDIVMHCKSLEIPRLRIGIRPQHPISHLANFVLSPFSTAEAAQLPHVFKVAEDMLLELREKGFEKTQASVKITPTDCV